MMAHQRARYLTLLPMVALVNVEVLRPHIEVLLFTLCEIEAVSVDRLLGLRSATQIRGLFRLGGGTASHVLRLLEHAEGLRVYEHRRTPVAKLSIVTDADY